jgi:outer membrane biosynthesis protein TonB
MHMQRSKVRLRFSFILNMSCAKKRLEVNLFNSAALETDDTKVDNAPPPEVSESLPAVDIAAAQVKETKPEEESPEKDSPEEEWPEEESPEEGSPEEESPEEESPEEESPEKESLEQQERSAIRRRAKERRLPAGESVVELKKQKIH